MAEPYLFFEFACTGQGFHGTDRAREVRAPTKGMKHENWVYVDEQGKEQAVHRHTEDHWSMLCDENNNMRAYKRGRPPPGKGEQPVSVTFPVPKQLEALRAAALEVQGVEDANETQH